MSRTESLSLRPMTRAQIVAVWTISLLSVAVMPSAGMPGESLVAQQEMPGWMRRGLPESGHAALKPLVGTWRAPLEIYIVNPDQLTDPFRTRSVGNILAIGLTFTVDVPIFKPRTNQPAAGM
jgi:hypothetical protein